MATVRVIDVLWLLIFGVVMSIKGLLTSKVGFGRIADSWATCHGACLGGRVAAVCFGSVRRKRAFAEGNPQYKSMTKFSPPDMHHPQTLRLRHHSKNSNVLVNSPRCGRNHLSTGYRLHIRPIFRQFWIRVRVLLSPQRSRAKIVPHPKLPHHAKARSIRANDMVPATSTLSNTANQPI